MKIEQLEQVLTIAKTGSMNKAAQLLLISQPNLSFSIKNLEAEFKIKIFERTPRGMVLTSQGQEFVSVIEPLYKQLELIPVVFKAGQLSSANNRLRVSSAFFKFVSNVFVETIELFQNKPCDLFFREGNAGSVLDDVATQHTDIGVLHIAGNIKSFMLKFIEYHGLVYRKIMDDSYKAIFGQKSALFHENRKSISLQDLFQYPLVLYDEKHSSMIEGRYLKSAGRHGNVIYVNNRAAMVDIISSTGAVNIGTLSEIPYRHTPFYSGLKTAVLTGVGHSQEIGLVFRTHYVPNKMEAAFINRLMEICDEDNHALPRQK